MSATPEDGQSYTPFPQCLEVLIGVYDKILLSDPYWRYEWPKKTQEYQENQDCVPLMNYIAANLNYFCEHMCDMQQKLQGTFKDDCPKQYLRTLISPNGQTDWSRTVWCIYSEVKHKGFNKEFNADVLAQMEDWLKSEGHPPSPQVTYGEGSARGRSEKRATLSELLQALHFMSLCEDNLH